MYEAIRRRKWRQLTTMLRNLREEMPQTHEDRCKKKYLGNQSWLFTGGCFREGKGMVVTALGEAGEGFVVDLSDSQGNQREMLNMYETFEKPPVRSICTGLRLSNWTR